MQLSNDQSAAVMHGLGKEKMWAPVPPATDVSDLPSWLLDIHIDFMRGASNSPHILLNVDEKPWPKGEPEIFQYEEEGRWRARSSDGWSMLQHCHGPANPTTAWRLVQMQPSMYLKDGVMEWQIGPIDDAKKHLENVKRDGHHPNAYIETKDIYATAKDNGYGGRVFWIKDRAGNDVALRGPFFGGTPPFWQEASFYARDDSRPYDKLDDKSGKPWYQRMGCFGYYVSEELVIKAITKFRPDLLLARVYPGYGHAHVEPYERDWGAPKSFMANELRQPGEGSL